MRKGRNRTCLRLADGLHVLESSGRISEGTTMLTAAGLHFPDLDFEPVVSVVIGVGVECLG